MSTTTIVTSDEEVTVITEGMQGPPGVNGTDGAVTVNGMAGNIILGPEDVGADPAGSAGNVAESLDLHVQNQSNPHAVTKSQINLGNVDNTSDINKPVSTAQAIADSQVASAAASALSAHTNNTSNPHSLTKSQINLGNVDNTSDASKPVSTAQAAANSAVLAAAKAAAQAQTALMYGITGDSVLLGIIGQSNAAGARNGGANPANPLIKTWDGVTNSWGGSDITQTPWTRANPDGNSGNNNTCLSFAHRLAEVTGLKIYIVYYFVGGTSIDHWVASGTSSDFYVAFKAKVAAALASSELVAAGITQFHALTYSQAEEDALVYDFPTYLGKFTMLDAQLRAESFIRPHMPIYVTGPSDLHDKYAPQLALQYYCAKINNDCIFIPSNGLKTDFLAGVSGGDNTHFQGPELDSMGRDRIFPAFLAKIRTEKEPSLFYGMSNGPANPASTEVVSAFNNLCNWDSRDLTSMAPLALARGSCSIMWGTQCAADGNNTYCLGSNTTTTNLCNYTIVAGRDSTATDNADYSASFGYQHVLNNPYTVAAGRGHTVSDDGQAALGLFSKYTTAQTDPVILQIGIGTSASAGSRKNAITARKSGIVEICTPTSTTAVPTQIGDMIFTMTDSTHLKISVRTGATTVGTATLVLTPVTA